MKELKEFPGYFVSKDGKIFSAWNKEIVRDKKGKIIDVKHYLDFNKIKEIKSSSAGNGYLKIGLRKDKKTYTKSIHRLVAETYIPNPNNHPVINHINEIKTDNNIKNLEWCTQQKNSEYSNCKYVYTIKNTKTNDIIILNNLNLWCKENNIHESHLRQTYTKNNQHKGFKIIKKESISALP